MRFTWFGRLARGLFQFGRGEGSVVQIHPLTAYFGLKVPRYRRGRNERRSVEGQRQEQRT